MRAADAERQIAKRNFGSFVYEKGRYKTQRTEACTGEESTSMDLVCDAEQHRDQVSHYEHQIKSQDHRIITLQRKLDHFRSWLAGVHTQVAAKDPQLLKNARRLYVGGIPEDTKEEDLRAFFEDVMNSTGAATAAGSSIASCKISSDKSYAFLEMRSVEEASNAMAFDGIVYNDVHLKIRRPSNYNAADAAALGPSTPDPTVETSHLPICKTVVEDSWNKIFVGGLPCNYGDEQVKELLQPYGPLKSFNLVMDKATGKSKGYAFCEFIDPRVIPAVINGLHMQCLERKVLTVKRALEGNRQGSGSKLLAPPLGAPPPAAAAAAAGSGGRLAAAPSGSLSSSSSSTALGFNGQQQQQQGFAGGPRGPRGNSAAAAAAAAHGARNMMHGDPGPAAAAAAAAGASSRMPDHGNLAGFYAGPGNNSHDSSGFGAGFGPGMPPMGPPGGLGPPVGFNGSGSSNRGFGSSGGGSNGSPGYGRNGPMGSGGGNGSRGGYNNMPHAHSNGASSDFPYPPGQQQQQQYHHHHHQQQQQQQGMMHGGSGNWNGMVQQYPHGHGRGNQGLEGVPGFKGSSSSSVGLHQGPRVEGVFPGVPPYTPHRQYNNSNGGMIISHGMTNNNSTLGTHTPAPPGATAAAAAAAATQLLTLNRTADGAAGSTTVARSGSGAFSGTACGTPGSTAASPVAAITGGTKLSPGIGGGTATAAAALAGGVISHSLAGMTNRPGGRLSGTGGDQAVHHVVLPGADAAAASISSSSGSLYHHDSLSAEAAAAAAAAGALAAVRSAGAAAAPAGEDSTDSSSRAAAAVEVLES